MNNPNTLMRQGHSPQDELWATGNQSNREILPYQAQGGALGAPMQPVSPLKKIHRLLRGRYLLAITLGLIFGIGGAVAGFFSQKPTWRSDGYIQINPLIVNPNNATDTHMPAYYSFVETQVSFLKSQRVIDQALSSDEWRKTGRSTTDEGRSAFADALEVQFVKGSTLIQISYTDPDRDITPIAVRSVIRAYTDIYGETGNRDLRMKVNFVRDQLNTVNTSLQNKQNLIMQAAREYATDELTEFHNEKLKELARIESLINEIQIRKSALQALEEVRGGKAGNNPEIMSIDEIATADSYMRQLVNQKAAKEDELSVLRRDLGEQHRQIIGLRAEIEMTESRIQKYADQYRQYMANRKPSNGAAPSIADANTIEELNAQEKNLRTVYETARAATNDIGKSRLQIQSLRNDIDSLKEQKKEIERRRDLLEAQLQFSDGRISVVSEGGRPASASNKGKQVAVLGFLGGGLLPIGFIMLMGLLDHRYRFSDDANEEISGINLLGILPNLPDRLSDPEQAGIAAHCVHQIRTMLQINGVNQGRSVYSVTSASPGDGKTSLTLALGLSFAASGSRTLLIDCDLVGAGLTSRMNLGGPEGVLEALATGDLQTYIRQTDIPSLSVLPVGSAHAHHVSSLSPGAVRKLLDTARKNYDIVLIDSGPILGSIEAALVGAAADGVVLAVSRGQQRPLVDRSLNYLRSIGAKLAGVVFNRAQADDFERSVARVSIRSVGTGAMRSESTNAVLPTDAKANRFGPVARAVASSVTQNKDGNGNGNG